MLIHCYIFNYYFHFLGYFGDDCSSQGNIILCTHSICEIYISNRHISVSV